jgi:PAP2 superfamily
MQDERGHTSKAWIALTPLIGAALIAISRTMDNRHHWQDVTTGSILGLILAFFAYRQYYPPLSSPISHRPYKPRTLHDKGQHAPGNVMATDLEGGLHVQSRNASAMNSEEDLRGHIKYYSHSRHGASESVSSGTVLLAPHTPHAAHTSTLPSRFKQVHRMEMEMDARSETSGSGPDEERGVSKPLPPKSIQDIWREERERGESVE